MFPYLDTSGADRLLTVCGLVVLLHPQGIFQFPVILVAKTGFECVGKAKRGMIS